MDTGFFHKPLSIKKIEEALIQVNYNLIYHNAFNSKKSLLREKKEQFLLVSIHKWMKDHHCNKADIKYLGNMETMLHQKEFEFHINNIESKTLSTVKFKFNH